VTDNEKSVAIATTEKRKRDFEENDQAAFSGVRQVSPTRLTHMKRSRVENGIVRASQDVSK
jgi:hypothetical protein